MRSEIVVDDVRGLGEFMHMTPAMGEWRVAIVDAADEMNRNAANAVLKILEEPPPKAVLLIVAHAPGRLLPTIRSRCRRLALQALADDTVIQLLADYAPDTKPDERSALAGLAEGSIGRALELSSAGSLCLYREMVDVLRPCLNSTCRGCIPSPSASRAGGRRPTPTGALSTIFLTVG